MTEPIGGKRRGCTRLPEVVIVLQDATLAYMIRCWYLEDMVPPWVRAPKWWSFYFRMDLDYRVIVRLFPRFV
ncbi:hypothetical protein M6B38_123290 [Iris pallida]|uniref:Uncharacterized protein n=1 Tax=Iris pallida TaxID=29817 RepID=A0AAX6H357_IRIPA|nr:hypothetical protein M6B38_123290 [Iris pallida]